MDREAVRMVRFVRLLVPTTLRRRIRGVLLRVRIRKSPEENAIGQPWEDRCFTLAHIANLRRWRMEPIPPPCPNVS